MKLIGLKEFKTCILVVDEPPEVEISQWLNYAGDDEAEING